jgi:drug/metabolite transporter (DMT)-like permease
MPWTLWVAFAALCVLSGTSWVIPVEMSSGLPSLEQQGILFGLIGVVAFLFGGWGVWVRVTSRLCVRLSAAAVGLFGVPMVVAEYARGSGRGINGAALFAMVPIVVVLVLAAGEDATREERGARKFLVPALVGLGGLLLLLPFHFSTSTRGLAMLSVVCAAVILAGIASVWLYRLLRGVRVADAIAVVGVSNAVFLLVWCGIRGEIVWSASGLASVVSVSSLVDVVEVLLIVWLLREMSPVRFASRYLLIPLLTILESYVLVRPEWTVRMGFGTVLLAVGAGVLLFGKAGEEETGLSLR